MRKEKRSGKYGLFLLLIAVMFSALSCQFGSSNSNSAATGSGGVLPGPAIGLAGLKAYRASFRQDVTGASFESHTQLELTRTPAF
jgi:hypothetical protein